MRFLNLCIGIICLAGTSLAQQLNKGPRIVALGNTGVALQDVWSLQSNPAGLAAIKNAQIAIANESHFLVPGINTRSVVLAYPSRFGVTGVSFQSYGIAEYREKTAGLAYSRKFGKTVFAAMKFNVHQVSISQYGTAEAWSVETGIQYAAADNLVVGVHIANPNRSSYGIHANATIPTVFELGACMDFSDKVAVNSAVVKEPGFSPGLSCGVEYNLAGKVFVRGGVATSPFRQFGGFGCSFQSFKIDVAAAFHPDLGYSPQIALGYVF